MTRQMCLFGPGPNLPSLVRAPPDILIAEDELLLREALQEALEAAGHRVASARYGQEALDALDRMARPALIILDLQMPMMDGVTFLAELRKRPDHADFHVLATSAVVHNEWLEHVPGVMRTLRKPFEVQEILTAADDFVSNPPPVQTTARPAHEQGVATAPAEQNKAVLGPEAAAAGPQD